MRVRHLLPCLLLSSNLAPDGTAKRPKCRSSSRGEYPMRLRLVFSLLSTVAFAPHLFAQSETPRYEVFGGYSYSRLADSYSTLEGTRFHGWNASVTKNLNRWLGVVADVSGHYSSESFAEGFFFTNSANLLAYRFGPKFSRRGRITPFAPSFGRRCPLSPGRNRFSGPVGASCRRNVEWPRNRSRWRAGRPGYRLLSFSSGSGRIYFL